MDTRLAFQKLYPQETALYEEFCPYRITPLGAHVDHQWGVVTGMAIDKGIHFTYTPTEDGTVEVSSLNFEGIKRFPVGNIPPKQNDWADPLRGAVKLLAAARPVIRGVRAVMVGSLPPGGLSSSAAVILGFLSVLCRVNDIALSDDRLIRLAQAVENDYVGVNCGILDQSCEVLGKQGKLLYLDTLDGSHRNLIFGGDPIGERPPYDIMVLFSGMERALASSPYNTVVENMQTAAYVLKGLAGLPRTTVQETHLRDVPPEVFARYRDRLTEGQRLCAEHFFEECQRVQDGTQAWQDGDLVRFGQLVSESGRSVVNKLGIGAPEMITLCDILRHTDGVYGACFSGAGFRGFCLALTDPAKSDTIQATVGEQYRRACPHLADKYASYVCHSADGIGNSEN